VHVEYDQIFERVIEDIYRGHSLQSLIQGDTRVVSYEDFLRWIKRDPQRHERFKEAQEARTEFLAGEILHIADGIESIDPNSNDTVNRDKLRIDTRKWLLSKALPKVYGDKLLHGSDPDNPLPSQTAVTINMTPEQAAEAYASAINPEGE
jgi:hypothetical protein